MLLHFKQLRKCCKMLRGGIEVQVLLLLPISGKTYLEFLNCGAQQCQSVCHFNVVLPFSPTWPAVLQGPQPHRLPSTHPLPKDGWTEGDPFPKERQGFCPVDPSAALALLNFWAVHASVQPEAFLRSVAGSDLQLREVCRLPMTPGGLLLLQRLSSGLNTA